MAENWRDWKTPVFWHRRTSRLERLKNCVSVLWTQLSMLPPPVRLLSALTLLVLLGLLTGCAAPSMPSSKPAVNPQMPPPSQSQPSQTYSSSARLNIERWQKLLTDTLTTP